MPFSFDPEKLSSPDPKVKYAYVKELLRLGKEDPASLYGYFDQWEGMLHEKNNIIRWMAIDLIGYLSSVDEKGKIDDVIPGLIHHLHSGRLITCNHAIFALGLIALNKPEHTSSILNELLTVQAANFETEECKNIAIGKILDAFRPLLPGILDKKEISAFIAQASGNSRNATRKRAEKLLKQLKKVEQ